MSERTRGLAVVMAGALLLAAGLGPGLGRPARALPGPGAGPPGVTIPYPGRLTLASSSDGAGLPVADGAYAFTFSLYDAETGGEPLWSETQEGVAVQGGAFTVLLGSATPLTPDLLGSGERWLEVAVRGPGEAEFTVLNPRQRLTAAASARPAANAACPHDHLGESWTGSDNPLMINGSFGTPDLAPLVLANSQAQGDGLRIGEAGDDGLQVDAAGGDGLFVDLAGDDGVNIFKAGNPGGYSGSTEHNGFEVAGAEGHGLFVGRAYQDGVHVYKAGNPGGTQPSSWPNGFEVEGAEAFGLWIGWSSQAGVYVHTAGTDGVAVLKTGTDGVQVFEAGNPSDSDTSAERNGFEVAGAEGHGLFVGWANVDGVYLNDSGDDGLQVLHAADEGVRVTNAGDIGVYANSEQADQEWGFYTPDKIYAGASVASGGPWMIVAQNGDASPLETGDVVAVSGIGPGLAGSEFPVPQVRRASDATGAVAGVVYRRFAPGQPAIEVEHQEQARPETAVESYSTEGPIAPSDYLLIVVLGAAQVKVEALSGGIRPGDLLAVGAEGRATRAAATTLVPGAIVGQAMGSLDKAQDSSLLWVLVMPR